MLRNKTALVTGAGRGIGKAIALELARQGAEIAILYAGNEQAAKDTTAQIEALGSRAKAYCCDVKSFAETKECTAQALADFGKIDILVNNAGVTKDGLIPAMSEEAFDLVLNTNLKGAFHMIRHLSMPMIKNKGGRIVNITSVSGMMGNAGQANYASAKAGLIGLTKTVAKELASRGITCNAVAPGFVETDMTEKLSEKVKDAALAQIPLKRMAKPEEIAKVVAFLCGDGAGYITGEIIKVDGGLYI